MAERRTARSARSSGGRKRTRASTNGRPRPLEVARRAATQLSQLTGRRPEAVLGLKRDDDGGWQVTLELLELQRVPNSTDLMACYVVSVDGEGELVGYERKRRYMRAQAEDRE